MHSLNQIEVALGVPANSDQYNFFYALVGLFLRMEHPKPHEWLFKNKEVAQPLSSYKNFNLISAQKGVIYIQPLGCFDEQFLQKLRLFCQAFYLGTTVKVRTPIQFTEIQREWKLRSRAQHPQTQFLTTDLLNYLKSILPKDADCMMAIADKDLYPYQSQTFVYGWAMYTSRVGIFSFVRWDSLHFEEPLREPRWNMLLYPSLRTMVHEIGHMFGISHCVYYRCMMSGFNDIQQNFLSPFEFCPICLKKLIVSLGFSPPERYQRLKAAAETLCLEPQLLVYKMLLQQVSFLGSAWVRDLREPLIRQHRNRALELNRKSAEKKISVQRPLQKRSLERAISNKGRVSKQRKAVQRRVRPPSCERKSVEKQGVRLPRLNSGNQNRKIQLFNLPKAS